MTKKIAVFVGSLRKESFNRKKNHWGRILIVERIGPYRVLFGDEKDDIRSSTA